MAEPSKQLREEAPVLEIENLAVAYKVRGGEVEAVQNVTLDIKKGESHGIVGESGCGKSTVAWSIINFLGANGYVKRGTIKFQGKNLVGKRGEELRRLRGDQIAMVYQDPMQSLNPSMQLGEQMKEVLTVHQGLSSAEAQKKCIKMLERVHMPDAANVMRRYPHQFSGGQRQRIGVARALALHPKLIVCDEAVSALDVSIQAQVINLLKDLQDDLGLTYLFISHDLSVVEHVGDRVAVMYLGKIVEIAPSIALYKAPLHPYTQALLSAVPIPNPAIQRVGRIILKGDVPSPIDPPPGCSFHPRCLYAREICSQSEPELKEIKTNHFAACFFAGEVGIRSKQL